MQLRAGVAAVSRAPLLTVDDVAAELRENRKYVLRLIHSGGLAASNIAGQRNGARYRIDPRDLDRWLESRRVAA
jgi:excisionase family DNA binding protein